MLFPNPRVVLSACGTELFTAGADEETRRLFDRHAHVFLSRELGEDRAAVEARVNQVASFLRTADAATARRASPELHGLLTFCEAEPEDPLEHFILLCSGTWLGERAAEIVKGWLQRNGRPSVELCRYHGLRMKDSFTLQAALAHFVPTWRRSYAMHRRHHFRVVFDLTAGCEILQTFLHTLGCLYADEIVRTCDGSLLRLPKLPIRPDDVAGVRPHLFVLRRLQAELHVGPAKLSDIPAAFLLRSGEKTALSPWGAIVWDHHKQTLYEEEVFPPPTRLVRFAETFLPSTRDLPADRRFAFNDRLDKLAKSLESDPRGPWVKVEAKPLRDNPQPPSTHEFEAWRDINDTKRVFCRYEGNVLVLDRIEDELNTG